MRIMIRKNNIIFLLLLSLFILFGCISTNGKGNNSSDLKFKSTSTFTNLSDPIKANLSVDKIITIRAVPFNDDNPQTILSNLINIDDLTNNSYQNSDFEIIITRGSQVFIGLKPINSALAYYSGNKNEDYSSCEEKIDEFSESPLLEFVTGNPICILSNEGRMGIIKEIQFLHNVDDTYSIEISIIIYSEKNKNDR